jgi:hypothetical protein
MTYVELAKLVENMYGNKAHTDAALLPRAIESLAVKLWLERSPETENTKVIRHQINHLHSTGTFDITGLK